MKKYLIVIVILMNVTIIIAQTPTPMSGNFTVSGETFTCRSIDKSDASSPHKIVSIINSRIVYFCRCWCFSAATPTTNYVEQYANKMRF